MFRMQKNYQNYFNMSGNRKEKSWNVKIEPEKILEYNENSFKKSRKLKIKSNEITQLKKQPKFILNYSGIDSQIKKSLMSGNRIIFQCRLYLLSKKSPKSKSHIYKCDL